MSQVTPLSDLARYAFNQLLADRCIDEVYENLNIYALLDDAELIELEAMLDKKAGDLGLAIGRKLRSRTVLEAFLTANAERLTAMVGEGFQVTLEADGMVMLIHLNDIPALFINQQVPAKALSLLAFVYFTNMDVA